jgi:hypothetical protein
MKVFDAFRLGGLATRRFPVWLHAFNILCGIAALAIAGFGIYFWVTREQRTLGGVLSGPRGARVVDREILVAKLEDPKEAAKLGKHLRDASEEDKLVVLEAVREEVLPGSVVTAWHSTTLYDSDRDYEATPSSDLAQRIIRESCREYDSPGHHREDFTNRCATIETRLEVATRMLFYGDARIRRRAVERLVALDDPRALAALQMARELPPGEEATAALACAALEGRTTTDPLLQGIDVELGSVAGAREAELRARAVVGLGMLRNPKSTVRVAHRLADEDPLVRAAAAWALGRIAAKDSRPALETALAKETYAPAREAMQKALDRLPR